MYNSNLPKLLQQFRTILRVFEAVDKLNILTQRVQPGIQCLLASVHLLKWWQKSFDKHFGEEMNFDQQRFKGPCRVWFVVWTGALVHSVTWTSHAK